jgi:hypothetical protein
MALMRLGQFRKPQIGRSRPPRAECCTSSASPPIRSRSPAGATRRAQLAAIHKTLPRYGVDDFLTAMQFAPRARHCSESGEADRIRWCQGDGMDRRKLVLGRRSNGFLATLAARQITAPPA